MKQRIIIAGGSGFLGKLLASHFNEAGYEVVILTRSAKSVIGPAREVLWDGRTCGNWVRELDGAHALINLAGRSVNCRYHARNRRLMFDSRIESTRVLGEAVALCLNPPGLWLNASTATINKHSFDRAWDEFGETGATPEAKDEFSVEIAHAWEKTFNAAPAPRTRKVLLRTAMVFSITPGTVFRVLRRLVRFGLGGAMAGGRQYVSWIHEADFCRAVEWLLNHDEISGPVVLAAPNPLPNREMMKIMRRVCGMRFGLSGALWMLEVGAFFLRTETELIIKSRRVVPGRLLACGFKFRFADLAGAVADLEARLRHRGTNLETPISANRDETGTPIVTRR